LKALVIRYSICPCGVVSSAPSGASAGGGSGNAL